MKQQQVESGEMKQDKTIIEKSTSHSNKNGLRRSETDNSKQKNRGAQQEQNQEHGIRNFTASLRLQADIYWMLLYGLFMYEILDKELNDKQLLPGRMQSMKIGLIRARTSKLMQN